MPVEHRPVDRRKFLRTAGAAASLSLSATSYANVVGSNARIHVGFIGCGGRAQAHLNLIVRLALENQGVSPVAVCDVWDGLDEEYDHSFGGKTTRRRYAQGLYPSAIKCGLNPADKKRVVKDYRRLLDLPDVDAVCIATPDHWHARQTLDAFAAGKDVYVEKPMTRTAAEARAVVDAAAKFRRVLTVGVQSLADPVWHAARERVAAGRIGHVSHVSGGVFRNDIRGQWRYYRLVHQMTPQTIDWNLFLGHRFEVNGERLGPTAAEWPFDRAVFAQWRCYRPFSGGPFTDLLSHQATRLLAATDLRYPYRVTAAGGRFVECDGRTVPDVGTLVADFDPGTQLVLSAATTSAYPMEEVIRGRTGAIRFRKGGFQIVHDDPRGGSGVPRRGESEITPAEVVSVEPPKNETEAMWRNFLDGVRRRDCDTQCGPELGAAAVTLTDLALRSFDDGRAYGWDPNRREAVLADAAWLAKRGGKSGGTEPPEYMRWASPTGG
jgi:predicted dehydrogenase